MGLKSETRYTPLELHCLAIAVSDKGLSPVDCRNLAADALMQAERTEVSYQLLLKAIDDATSFSNDPAVIRIAKAAIDAAREGEG